MDPWAEVRLRARECHAEALAAAGGGRTASALVRAATALRDIEIAPFVPGTRFAPGILGVYERVGLLLHIDATLPAGARELVMAHELGHHELHDDPIEEVKSVDHKGQGGAARLVGYSHRERREVAADAFAVEFLCPADWVRGEILDRGLRPFEIARALGVPEYVVVKQVVRAVLLPPLEAPLVQAAHDVTLDPTQAAAATWAGGPLLVEAGPGTGKTATLVGRVAHLLNSGVPATKILVLTFSLRAAAELRQRVAEIAPDAAGDLWAGTFHAFGLEVLHGWHDLVGRGPRPRILDRDGALDLLERNLDRLPPLSVHRDLRNPGAALEPVLRAIERCKDEMVTPADYASAARVATFNVGGDAGEAAEELAAIYAAYQDLLAEEDAFDLGDLVAETTQLLEQNDAVARHYGERFAHVLVDEYQDVNAASVRLLSALCGPGTNLWVVGDGRQSIYRFRGAGPYNLASFASDFGGETLALGRNYRATGSIITGFATFARSMSGTPTWTPLREEGEAIRVMSAPTVAGEIAAVRGRIEELRRAGVSYSDQAILARTHVALDRVCRGLERLAMPLLHIGDLFARDEVRDLLALLSIDAEPGGIGLLRVAALPVYAIPRTDAVAVIRWAATNGMTIERALSRAASIPGVSPAGAKSLMRLGCQLAAVGPNATAWTVLTTWLFETHAPCALVGPGAGRSAMGDAAVYQLLRLAAEEGGGRRRFLARVRRIAALGGGREHGVVAPEAEQRDAVRVMTIHAAKGAEFAAVHLPTAASRFVPMRRRPDAFPPPPDLAQLAMRPEDHDGEERNLWFVALSRARDYLTISHARRYTPGSDTRPSPFVARSGPVVVSEHPHVDIDEPSVLSRPQRARSAYLAHELETYLRCPARYAYETLDGLAGVTPQSNYRRFLTAVHAATKALQLEATRLDALPTDDDARKALAASWSASELSGHPSETYYRSVAERMMTRMAKLIGDGLGDVWHDEDWAVDLGVGVVIVRPHRVIEHPWGAVTVQELRLGRQADPAVTRSALILTGAREHFPHHHVTVEALDPETGETTEAFIFDEQEAMEPYREAIVAIEHGNFGPTPKPKVCPSCPFFFVCGV